MREYINIGCSPYEEDCCQVGRDSLAAIRAECHRYKALLEKTYPGVIFGVKSFPHDFGTYCEVVAYYDPEDFKSIEAAFNAENGVARW